ncbi:DUF6418 domain-containing protein [Erwinia sp. HR93]|uniref:DUF6418 domain-containing protein n=1 Tax=Erwinia sp. HR93 TaxID=3094840 RepID=UPI002ADEE1E1|nr:DUF6418 domain-containing protein [Erwinia sp. HR93]MEA1065398.1 DUF6418 domain-containing protein [Erwinia sp. HR93]
MKINIFNLLRISLLSFTVILMIFNSLGINVTTFGLIILFLYLGTIFFYRPLEYANNLMFFIIIVPMLIGGALIENGTYLFEIDTYSHWNGTFINNLFFSMFFIELLLINKSKVKNKLVFSVGKIYIEGFIVVSIFVLYIAFLKTGIPLLNGVHRSVYFSSIVPGYINLLKGRLSFVCLVLGVYYFTYKHKRFLIYFMLIVLYHILCSIKGGELLIVIYCFYLPSTLYYTVRVPEQNKNKIYRKIQWGLMFFIVAIFSVVFFNYQTVENYDRDTTALEKIQKRIEAAGQIWWVINDEHQVSEQLRWDKFTDNLIEGNDKFDQGMNQLMNEVVPGKILNSWRSSENRGRSLANGFPAIGYYYFGYFGVIMLLIITGTIIIIIKNDILSSFISGDILSFLFIGPILELVIRMVAQGDINLFFEGRTLAIVFAYITYGLMKRAMIRSKTL